VTKPVLEGLLSWSGAPRGSSWPAGSVTAGKVALGFIGEQMENRSAEVEGGVRRSVFPRGPGRSCDRYSRREAVAGWFSSVHACGFASAWSRDQAFTGSVPDATGRRRCAVGDASQQVAAADRFRRRSTDFGEHIERNIRRAGGKAQFGIGSYRRLDAAAQAAPGDGYRRSAVC